MGSSDSIVKLGALLQEAHFKLKYYWSSRLLLKKKSSSLTRVFCTYVGYCEL